MTLHQIIKSLQNTQGTLSKQAIMGEHKDNELFKAYMKATYDVGINYYQSKAPKVAAGNLATMDEEFIQWIVENIAGRKVTGNAAISLLKQTLACMDEEGQELAGYIIKRSIGSGVGDKMVLKTWPGLYFIPPYMRCASMDKKVKAHYASLPYFFVQDKRDGSFAYLSTTQVVTRQGSKYPEWFVGRMSYGLPDGIVLIGEMEVYDAQGNLMKRADGNGVLNSVLQGGDELEFNNYKFSYVVWDCTMDYEFEMGRSDKECELRLELMYKLIVNAPNVFPIDNKRVTSVAEANKLHIARTKDGKEGTVWKDPKGLWRNSSGGTMDAVKNKVVFSADYEIEDAYEGEGKYVGMLGGIKFRTPCGKLRSSVGTGFSDSQRIGLWEERERLPGMIIEVEANDITEARNKDTYALSHSAFIEVRMDKKEADSLERVFEQFEAAKEGRNEEI
ncbi:MAG: hypothetical protein ACXW1D_00170 [Halobacteriota archaeon]